MPSQAIHPAIIRFTHWINAGAVLVMMFSGWQIYNAAPILPFEFPLALGGWLGGALLWHFAAMWLLMFNGIIYLAYGLFSGRLARKLLPMSPSAVVKDAIAALRGTLAHDDLSSYNAVQRLLYAGVIALILLVTLSGLAIWKPVQLAALSNLFGGFQGARLVHFLAMAGIAAFIVVHVVMALLVPRSLKAMVTGKA